MAQNYAEKIRQYIAQEQEILACLDRTAVNAAILALEGARQRGATVYVCGNGGSASTASHFAGDFNKGVNCQLEEGEPKYRFVSLSDNISSMMAIANDLGYERIFVEPLRGILRPEDIVIGISGSGNSPNVLLAAAYAHEVGATVIGLTGYGGGKLREQADISLHVPVDNMQIAEDLHLILEHLMMWVLSTKGESAG